MRLAQYHAIGGGGHVVLRSFKKTCCKKAGWWTFSRCLILKSSAASIPETIISQGCSWPMKGNIQVQEMGHSILRRTPLMAQAIYSGDLIA